MQHVAKTIRRRKYRRGSLESQYREQIQLWILRILIKHKGYRAYRNNFTVDNVAITDALLQGWGHDLEDNETDYLSPSILETMLEDAQGGFCKENTALGVGLDMLVKALELTPVERDVLEFLILMKSCYPLNEAVRCINEDMDISSVCSMLGAILGRPPQAIETVLSPTGALISAGLIRIDPDLAPLRHKIELARTLVDKLSTAHAEEGDVFNLFLDRAPAAILAKDDFQDCMDRYGLVSEYLEAALNNGLTGVNILIYGAPGVGKTQMARCICDSLGLSLFEVPDQDSDGRACSAEKRFSAYQLTQKLIEKQDKCVVLFDELEDVFPSPDIFADLSHTRVRSTDKKSWLNRLLESNNTPTIWIGNEVSHLDPAYLRRFDLVVDIPRPGQSTRKQVLQKILKNKSIETGKWFDTLADSPYMTPGLIEKAVRVIRAINPDETRVASLYQQVTGSVIKAMGHEAPSIPVIDPVMTYDPEMANADVNPDMLVRGLASTGEGRVLLYGAPGTGKTELARYLAKSLDKPLIIRKPSDLLGKYVGQTEKNLAKAFEEAVAEDAVLLLDEVDSFLRTRLAESRSWEITQVNELLVQIESFKGILVACTNAFNTLDEAALRRFDVKVKFGYLSTDQVRTLFYQVLGAKEGALPEEPALIDHRLARLELLTPGDFHAVVRRLRITGVELNAQSLFSALQDESARKTEYRGRGIGFSAVL